MGRTMLVIPECPRPVAPAGPPTIDELRAKYIGVLIEVERRKAGFDAAACDHIEDLLARWCPK